MGYTLDRSPVYHRANTYILTLTFITTAKVVPRERPRRHKNYMQTPHSRVPPFFLFFNNSLYILSFSHCYWCANMLRAVCLASHLVIPVLTELDRVYGVGMESWYYNNMACCEVQPAIHPENPLKKKHSTLWSRKSLLVANKDTKCVNKWLMLLWYTGHSCTAILLLHCCVEGVARSLISL